MQALLATAPGKVSVSEVSLRRVHPGEVRVRLDAAAMCVTDFIGLEGDGFCPFPLIPGHSATGVVVETGTGLKRVQLGDRVIIAGTQQCGTCYSCTHGSPGACDEIWAGMETPRAIGTNALGATVYADGGVGTLSEEMIYRECNVVVVDSNIDPQYLARLGCGLTSGLGAVLEVAQVKPKDSVAVSGCGHLGLWMIQAARLAGASTSIAVDPRPERRQFAMEMGATHALDASDAIVDQVRALTDGRGVDVGFEAAGKVAAMEQSFLMTRPGGTVVPTGMDAAGENVTLPNFEYSIRDRKVLSSQTGGGDIQGMIPRFAALMDKGQLDYRSMVSRTYLLDQVPQALEDLRRRRILTGVVLFPGTGPTGKLSLKPSKGSISNEVSQ